jgi:hypothetical protein
MLIITTKTFIRKREKRKMKTQETPSSQKTHGPIINESLGAGEVKMLEPQYGNIKKSGRYKWVSTDEEFIIRN